VRRIVDFMRSIGYIWPIALIDALFSNRNHKMTQQTLSRSERYQRYSSRGMLVLLILVLAIGAIFIAVSVSPNGLIAAWLPRVSTIIPIAIAMIGVALHSTLRGDRWDPRSPEARMVLQDEWRQTNLSRAMRIAFVAVVAVQVPLALWLGRLPSQRAVMAMAVITMTLAMATLIALFLFFERGDGDGS
jgi:hypothetical protein